jgi:hypothetical protein
MLEVFLMDEESAAPSAIEKAKNGREIFSDKIADEIVAACGSGFTLEKAGALVGVNPSTIRTWAQRKPEFGKRVETARKKHELSLLKDIQLAGEKSWQAKAWILERGYNWAQPSARLQVSQDVTHGISGNLAQLLAGIAGRKKITAIPEKRQIESGHNYIDIQPVTTKPENDLSNNKYCINKTNSVEQQQDAQSKTPKLRHKQMRRRKPRAESLAKYPPTTTPPADPPTAI